MSKKAVACRHLEFLKLLSRFGNNKKQFKLIISRAAKSELDAVSEIILNFLNGHIKCNVKKYRRHSTSLRNIANRSNTSKARKKNMLRAGHGVILPLISLALPILLNILKK